MWKYQENIVIRSQNTGRTGETGAQRRPNKLRRLCVCVRATGLIGNMPPTAEPPTVAKKEASAALPNKNKAKQKVSLNIIYPPFEPELLDFWFLALEATFVMNGHYSDRYRYNALITCLGSRAKMVRKTIQMCSTLNSKKKYKILKAAVRACFPTVEEQKPATTPHPLTTVKLGEHICRSTQSNFALVQSPMRRTIQPCRTYFNSC